MPFPVPSLLAQAAPPGGGGILGSLPFLAAMLAILYFVLIRPQQKQVKEQQTMLSALKKGDDVITSGGLVGKIFAVLDDRFVMLEIASGVKVRLLKSSVQGKVTVEAAKSESTEPKKEEK